jgi:hypothetical protein
MPLPVPPRVLPLLNGLGGMSTLAGKASGTWSRPPHRQARTSSSPTPDLTPSHSRPPRLARAPARSPLHLSKGSIQHLLTHPPHHTTSSPKSWALTSSGALPCPGSCCAAAREWGEGSLKTELEDPSRRQGLKGLDLEDALIRVSGPL